MAKKKADGGRLIVFEGPDGVGKSTLSAALVDELRARGRRVELTTFSGKEPGCTAAACGTPSSDLPRKWWRRAAIHGIGRCRFAARASTCGRWRRRRSR
jgi:hypothetical protein